HAEDMGTEDTQNLVTKPDGFWAALKSGNAKVAKRLLDSSSWKAASLKLLGIPGAQFFYSLKRYLSA
ncbi:MAG: hypothetical protein AAFU53_06520, partial [Cyanobacteria bacterium J06632_3]